MYAKRNERRVLEISGKASADTILLGGSVDRDKNEVGLLDALVDIGGEEEVAATGLADDVLKTGLVDGKLEVLAVPRVNTRLFQVNDGDSDFGTFESNDRACRAA